MPRQPTDQLLEPFFIRAASAAAEREYSEVTANSVSLAMAELASACDPPPAGLDASLAKVAGAFSIERGLEPYLGSPGHQKQLLRALRDGGNVREVLDAMAPEFVIELSGYLRKPAADWVLEPVGNPTDTITRVRRAAAKFERDYEPSKGRRTDLALETAVRELIGLVEPVIGHFPKVAGNKNNGRGGPTPGCAGALAIVIILRGIDGRLTTTAIMNMISKVKDQPEPTENPLLTLMRANLLNQLDCSLLPGREEAIERLRAEYDPL